MQKIYALLAQSFLILAALVNTSCDLDPDSDEFQSNLYVQISANLPNVDTLHFFNENTQSGNHVVDYYVNSINASRSYPYVSQPPFGSIQGSGITFDLVKDITLGMWLPVTQNYFEDAQDPYAAVAKNRYWFRDVFDFMYVGDASLYTFTYPSYLNNRVSAPFKSWDMELEWDSNLPGLKYPSGRHPISLNLDRYIGYNKVTKTLEFYELDIASLAIKVPAPFDTKSKRIAVRALRLDIYSYLDHYAMPITLTKVDSITFKEHALWSRDGTPFLDKEKTWKIIEIRDSVGTLLNSSGYDCLYDNTFTFSAGNSLKLDIGLVHCASIDQPLLDNNVTQVFQQYTVVTDSTVTPYVYITTPGALFAPQRMFMISFDQETAELSSKFGTDSITLKVQAI